MKVKVCGMREPGNIKNLTNIRTDLIGYIFYEKSSRFVELNEDLEELKNSSTISVALPSCSFYINIPYAPARKIIDAGLPLALASDYNPGSTPSGNIQLVLSLASIKQKLIPNEAINAVTINGAYAMNLQNELGSITVGKKANLIITKPMESIAEIPYWFGNNLVNQLILNGKLI